jgi:hypothetical protein
MADRKPAAGVFIDQDPIIDKVRTVVHNDPRSYDGIAHATHGQITGATIRNWLWGNTKRPQWHKVTAVLNACEVDVLTRYRATGLDVIPDQSLAKAYADIHRQNVLARQNAILARAKAAKARRTTLKLKPEEGGQ